MSSTMSAVSYLQSKVPWREVRISWDFLATTKDAKVEGNFPDPGRRPMFLLCSPQTLARSDSNISFGVSICFTMPMHVWYCIRANLVAQICTNYIYFNWLFISVVIYLLLVQPEYSCVHIRVCSFSSVFYLLHCFCTSHVCSRDELIAKVVLISIKPRANQKVLHIFHSLSSHNHEVEDGVAKETIVLDRYMFSTSIFRPFFHGAQSCPPLFSILTTGFSPNFDFCNLSPKNDQAEGI